jgi:hypothetical protein
MASSRHTVIFQEFRRARLNPVRPNPNFMTAARLNQRVVLSALGSGCKMLVISEPSKTKLSRINPKQVATSQL